MQQTLIVSSEWRSFDVARRDTVVVATPLDAIVRLERWRRITTVVLAGVHRELETFLRELYPSLRIECEA